METMSALDAAFLHVEDQVTHMHIGAVAVFEGPPPPQERILAAVEAKLHRVPRYRQRPRFAPLAFSRPVWSDDPHFRLDYHVRRTALPAPGGDAELEALVARVLEQRLDRDKPLWEWWVVEGVRGDQWALISKVHHAVADGIAATALLDAVLDGEREHTIPAPQHWNSRPDTRARLLAHTGVELATRPARSALAVAGALRRGGETASQAVAFASGMVSYSRLLKSPPASSLNGPIGPHRGWTVARVRLADLKTVRKAFGCTVNDVVLTVVAEAFRELLLARGEQTGDRVLRTMVPVSIRTEGQRGQADNRVSAIFADLPVRALDPVDRLLEVHDQMERLKARGEAYAGAVLTNASGFAPAMLWAIGNQIGTRTPQHSVNTVATNVPGPQRPWYLLGRRMLEAYPFVPVGGHVRIGLAIFSYDGGVAFGITSDRDRAPDAGLLVPAIERAVADLVRAAGGPAKSGGTGKTKGAASRRRSRPAASRGRT